MTDSPELLPFAYAIVHNETSERQLLWEKPPHGSGIYREDIEVVPLYRRPEPPPRITAEMAVDIARVLEQTQRGPKFWAAEIAALRSIAAQSPEQGGASEATVSQSKFDNLVADYKRLEGELREAKQVQRLHRDMERGDYWAWAGDGADHPESLVCPVLVPAQQIREWIAAAKPQGMASVSTCDICKQPAIQILYGVARCSEHCLQFGDFPEEPQAEAQPIAEHGERWLLWFEDVDRKPEHFSGAGAEQGARARYEQMRGNWSCRLFSSAASSPECPDRPMCEARLREETRRSQRYAEENCALREAVIRQSEAQPVALKVRLPIITDELREEFNGKMKLMDETGWTQNAVDFACLLQGTQTFVLSAPPQPVALSEEEERAAFEAHWRTETVYPSARSSALRAWMARARLAKERGS